MKVIVATWSHPDGNRGTLGVYNSQEAADKAIFEDTGFCHEYWDCSIKSRPEKICKTHNRPIEGVYGNWKAWIEYDKQEFNLQTVNSEHTHECVRITAQNAQLLGNFSFDLLPDAHKGDGCECHAEFTISEADRKEFGIVGKRQ